MVCYTKNERGRVMKKIETFIFNEELIVLLENVQSRDHFTGLLWSLELFFNKTNIFSHVELYQRIEKRYNSYLNDFKQDNCNFESAKENISNVALYFWLNTVSLPISESGTTTPDKEFILILSEILSRIYLDFEETPEYCNIARTVARLKQELYPYLCFEVISNFMADLKLIIDNFNEGTFVNSGFHYNLRLSLLELRKKISNLKVVNIYLLGEDKHDLLKSQSKSNIYIYGETSIQQHQNDVNILWVTKKNIEISKSEYTDFDCVVTSEDIQEIVDTCLKNLQNLSVSARFYHSLKREYSLYLDNPEETIVLGSSYGRTGVIKQFSEQDFIKLAVQGGDCFMTYTILRYFLEHCGSPDTVKRCILPISYWFFFADRSITSDLLPSKPFTTYFHELFKDVHNYPHKFVSDFYDKMLNECKYSFYVKYCLDTVSLDHQIYSRFISKGEELFPDPQVSNTDYIYWTKTRQIISAIEEPISWEKFLKYENTLKENQSILVDFIDLLAQFNIDLIVLLTPMSKTFLEGVTADVTTAFEKNLQEFFPNFQYIDMNNLAEIQFEDSDFLDSTHLNRNGAEKFTHYINKIINEDIY